MDARRLELYELLKPTLGDEPAQKLVLELGPDREYLATKQDLDALRSDVSALESRMNERFAQVDARFDRLENVLTRRMIAILGSWTVVVGSAFAWASVLLR